MRYIRYSRYTGEAADDVDLQDLMNKLSDFLLQSGFESQYGIYEMDPQMSTERMMDELREAILRALEEGDLIPPELMEQLMQNPDLSKNQELREMIDRLIERLQEEGFISQQPPQVTPPPSQTPGGQIGRDQSGCAGAF